MVCRASGAISALRARIGFGHCVPGRLLVERTDLPELEQALRVGLRLGHPSPELRQPGGGEENRQPALGRPVKSRAQRRELRLRDVLHFVDNHHQSDVRCGRRGSERLEQGGEVELEDSAVGDSRFDGRIDPQLEVSVCQLEPRHEPGKNPARTRRTRTVRS